MCGPLCTLRRRRVADITIAVRAPLRRVSRNRERRAVLARMREVRERARVLRDLHLVVVVGIMTVIGASRAFLATMTRKPRSVVSKSFGAPALLAIR